MTERVLEIDVNVEVREWVDLVPRLEQTVSVAAEAAVAACGYERGKTELSVLATNDEKMTVLNQEWRGKSGSTNVLSFPGELNGPGPLLLGDIALALETVDAEAEAAGISAADHLTHLVVHGVLHLLGYDHETDPDAGKMENLETEILRSLGIADPYAAGRAELSGVAT